ncbi:hypothetical protein chiPu_0017542 [Chiloscyllium punctatum]|uniref:Uncharacterized protein n=1 Tax=Chiloscyllium punctatum TaxID=137246 RepID=A0A401RGU8_CHIPU|nr:hypothetical protein [Chiloscyllium punctatum]
MLSSPPPSASADGHTAHGDFCDHQTDICQLERRQRAPSAAGPSKVCGPCLPPVLLDFQDPVLERPEENA